MSERWVPTDESDNTFSKQEERRHVFRLRREELEQRFLHLRDDMMALKQHSRKQEDKIKKMASKLIRLINEKKRVGRRSDKETEELITKMQKRIRELYRENVELKSKICCSEQKYLEIKQTIGKKSEAPIEPLPPPEPPEIPVTEPPEQISDVDTNEDINKFCWQFGYWFAFLMCFLIVYKFFMSNLCNYILDYYFHEYL